MLIQNYCKGKTPFRIWFYSSAAGALVLVSFNIFYNSILLDYHLIFTFLFSTIINMLFTLPIFLTQSKVICDTLQKNKKNVMNVMLLILILGWLTEALIGFFIYKFFFESRVMFDGKEILIINFTTMAITWTNISLYTIRKSELQKF
jgi:hypothetical protein